MNITTSYPGGNIRILSMEGDTVHLTPDRRDTPEEEFLWSFYWSFRVDGAEGRTITFDFGDKNYVGYWGPAISYDNRNWKWMNNVIYNFGDPQGENFKYSLYGTYFTYTFGPDETSVYFCHDMHYSVERFYDFARETGLTVETLCMSEKNVPVPMVRIGTEGPALLLGARAHCCESTGSYSMEGILREFAKNPPKDFHVIAIPFIDLDGALAGDQGKCRAPHDHNRDYIEQPIYRSTKAMMELEQQEDIRWAIDLHAPCHQRCDSDFIFAFFSEFGNRRNERIFLKLLDGETHAHPEAFPFMADFPFQVPFRAAGTFQNFFASRPNKELVCCLEHTYAGHYGYQQTQSSLIEFGACVARVLRTMCEYN